MRTLFVKKLMVADCVLRDAEAWRIVRALAKSEISNSGEWLTTYSQEAKVCRLVRRARKLVGRGSK